MNKIDFNHLYYFYMVVTYGGFTKAAEQLSIHQPVVSRAIKILEMQCEQKLIERNKRKVILTEAGEKLFNQAREVCSHFDEINRSLIDVITKNRSISLAFSDSLSLAAIGALSGIQNSKDQINRVTHRIGSCSTFIDDISNGQVDMGFFFNVPELPSNLIKTKIADVNFVYVAKTSHSKDALLMGSFICTTPDKNKRAEDMPLFKKYKVYQKTAKIVFVSNSSIVRKSCVNIGMGVTILPEFMVKNELNKKTLKIVGDSIKLPLYLIERSSSYRNSIKNRLISEVIKLV